MPSAAFDTVASPLPSGVSVEVWSADVDASSVPVGAASDGAAEASSLASGALGARFSARGRFGFASAAGCSLGAAAGRVAAVDGGLDRGLF